MRESKVLGKLRSGQAALLVNISLSPNPLAVEMAGRTGIDGVWIDMEHRPLTQREVAHMIAGARLGDIDAMPRIRKDEGYTAFFRPLEDGAAGIMVPHIKTREEAEWVVRNAKYPPLGRRGMESVMPDADLSFSDPLEYMEHANRETFVVIQIEDAEALDNLDEIAAVEGVDVIFVGPSDLTVSMGIPLQKTHPRYLEAEAAIARAAAKHGKWWGRPIANPEDLERCLENGGRFFNMASDFGLLKAGFLQTRQIFDEIAGRCLPDA
jgi:4-hydroxy-2-oxoheptanedioate aldolase